MEEKKLEIEQLASNWKSLYQEMKKNNKISLELFEETFSSTYRLLCQKVAEPSIEKSLLSVIVNASLFAHIDATENLDSKYKAALVLTERMLSSVTAENLAAPCDKATIYIFELRQEVCINFKDVSDSITVLTELYESDFWKKLQK